MKGLSLLLATTLMGVCASAVALDTAEILRKAKGYAVPAPANRVAVGDPLEIPAAMFDLVPRSDHGVPTPRGACEGNASNLCYDVDSKRIVYRPIRKYMPTVEGLTPENISVKRNAIVLKYSFK